MTGNGTEQMTPPTGLCGAGLFHTKQTLPGLKDEPLGMRFREERWDSQSSCAWRSCFKCHPSRILRARRIVPCLKFYRYRVQQYSEFVVDDEAPRFNSRDARN